MTRPTKVLLSASVVLAVFVAALFGIERLRDTAKPPGQRIAELFPRTAEYDFDVPEPGSYALPRLKAAPDGTVIGRDGGEIRLKSVLGGKVSLVSFVYFLCADADGCPLATATLFDLYDASGDLPGLAKKVQLVTISFDPERDTPEAVESFIYPVLADPARQRKIDWRAFTTANGTVLQPILDGFGQVVDRRPDSDVINHLLRLYLLDASGRIRNIYGLGMIDPRLILTDVETLLMETGDTVAGIGY